MNNLFTVFDCNIISFPRNSNKTGSSMLIQNGIEVPFDVKRLYYLYDVPSGESRGIHAHRTLQQVLIAASGSFDVTLDDGRNKKTVHLSRPFIGLHIRPGIWRDIINFSSGVICLVLASELYKEEDYIRDYDEFKRFKGIIQ